jgi:hypothetical protein
MQNSKKPRLTGGNRSISQALLQVKLKGFNLPNFALPFRSNGAIKIEREVSIHLGDQHLTKESRSYESCQPIPRRTVTR